MFINISVGDVVLNNILFEKISESIKELPKNFITSHDIEENLKVIISSIMRKLNIVTREEFDIQQQVLLATRKKLDEIEAKLDELVK
ncbi:MAG: accessory factor UbiK family protein [Neisseriaceae bacterium]